MFPISLRTTSQSARTGFILLTHAANNIDRLVFSGEKQISCFIKALHRLVMFFGNRDIWFLCASLISSRLISAHLICGLSSSTFCICPRSPTAHTNRKIWGFRRFKFVSFVNEDCFHECEQCDT